jgi:hypothetical protein
VTGRLGCRLILGFVPIPNGDFHTTNFAFGGPDNQYIFMEGASTGTFWRFKAPYPGLIGPGGTVCGATLSGRGPEVTAPFGPLDARQAFPARALTEAKAAFELPGNA